MKKNQGPASDLKSRPRCLYSGPRTRCNATEGIVGSRGRQSLRSGDGDASGDDASRISGAQGLDLGFVCGRGYQWFYMPFFAYLCVLSYGEPVSCLLYV